MGSRAPVSSRLHLALALCFLLPLSLYALTAARTVQGGDAGEFGVVAALGGVVHPPGYPTYVLLERLFSHLPFGPLYWRFACASAVCGAAASAVLFRLCLDQTGSLPASIFAALAFALAPIEWRLSGVPEVFSLHALACATAILCACRLAGAETFQVARRSALLGLVLGLGMANHQTLVLLAPVVLWSLPCGWSRVGWGYRGKSAALFVGAGVIGLTPYLLLMRDARSASEHSLVWGRTGTLAGLVNHILRRDYGTFQLASGNAVGATDPARYVEHFLRNLPGSYVFGFFLVGVWGVAVGARRRRGLTLSLLASLLLCLLFLSIFNLTDTPTHREVVERFHLMPTLLFAPFVAWGLAELIARGLKPVVMIGLGSALLIGGSVAAWSSVDWARDSSVERFTIAEVHATGPNPIVLVRGDTEGAALLWVTQVLQDRPDVRYLDTNLLSRSWYFERMRDQFSPIPLPLPRNVAHIGELANELLPFAPTYVIPSLSIDAATTAALEPAGFLDRVVPAGTAPLPLDEVESRLRKAMGILGPQPRPVDAWADELRVAAVYRWLKLGEELRGAGQQEKAAACSAEAHAIMPAE